MVMSWPATRHARHALVVSVLIAGASIRAAAGDLELTVETGNHVSRLIAQRDGERVVLVETERTIQDARLRDVPGSAAVGVTWSEHAAGAPPIAYFSVSTDGHRFAPARAAHHDLLLNHGSFDPLVATPVVPETLRDRGGSLHIVQYWTQPLEAYRAAIRALGGEVLFFLANQANVVAMGEGAAVAAAELPFVRWVGPFHPAYKIDGTLATTLAAMPAGERLRVNLVTTRRGPESQLARGSSARPWRVGPHGRGSHLLHERHAARRSGDRSGPARRRAVDRPLGAGRRRHGHRPRGARGQLRRAGGWLS